MNVGFRILHPLFDGMSITWTREEGADVSYAALVEQGGLRFPRQPLLPHALDEKGREWRLRLDQDPAIAGFPLLMQLKEKGYTDYLALIVAFGGAELHPQSLDGLRNLMVDAKRAQGFSDTDVAAMRARARPARARLSPRHQGPDHQGRAQHLSWATGP